MAQTQHVNLRIENIFAHAAALDQAGRLRNTIYCIRNQIYILNQDFTVLLQFRLRKNEEAEFAHPVSFRANDYDSRQFRENKGRIEFLRQEGKWQSVKSCATPERSPEDVQEMFRGIERPDINAVVIGKEILPLINEELSHLEISVESGKLQVVQRNIYDGTVITITLKEMEGSLSIDRPKLKDFAPLGIRTNDFIALYSFADHLRWRFAPDVAWVESTDPKLQMIGVISQCVYDELGRTVDGRKKSQERGDQQGADRENQEQPARGKELRKAGKR